MTLYHGTTLDAARKIQEQGLIPHRETTYQLADSVRGVILRNLQGEDKPYIYLQTKQELAEEFARYRATYERAKRGEHIETANLQGMEKISDERQPNAKPALVTISLPATIARKLKRDPQNWDGGKVCLCTIPPRYIVAVTEVR